MVEFLQKGTINSSDDGSLVAFIYQSQWYVYSFKARKFIKLPYNAQYTTTFLNKLMYLNSRLQTRVYTQNNLRLQYTFRQKYYSNLIKINEFGLILLQNQRNDFAILTIKGKIIRKKINIPRSQITYLRLQSNRLQIYYEYDYFTLQNYNISKGKFEQSIQMKKYAKKVEQSIQMKEDAKPVEQSIQMKEDAKPVQNEEIKNELFYFQETENEAYGLISICYYKDIWTLDFSRQKLIKIFKDNYSIKEIPYLGKEYTVSGDRKYIAFYLLYSCRIDFYNCFSQEFEEPYHTNLPIEHARRVNEKTLEIKYFQSFFQIVNI